MLGNSPPRLPQGAALLDDVDRVGRHSCRSNTTRVGVCVTGEARSFAMPAVRASLREFLGALSLDEPSVTVRMIIGRRASSSWGWTFAHDPKLRHEAVRNRTFTMTARQVRQEFAAWPTSVTPCYPSNRPATLLQVRQEFAAWPTSVTLEDASDCRQPAVRNHSCCAISNGTAPPGAFLQYATMDRCVSELVRAPSSMLHTCS